jgi:IclR family transcriptional regulator, KDG regulon repressor
MEGAKRDYKANDAPDRTEAATRGSLRDQGGVQSIERAFAILEEVARHRAGIRLGDLSKRVGLHNSTTFHLVKTMVLLGYLRQMPDKLYRVGRPLFKLAAGALDEVEMVALATPVLDDLSAATQESCHFAVRSGREVIVLARTAGSGPFQLTERAGVVRPAHCTALGKILLAAMGDGQLAKFFEHAALEPFTDKTITDAAELTRQIEEVRRSGVAYDDGEFNAEVRCAAVPVYGFTGQVQGAIGISGPIWRLSIQLLKEKSKLVRNAAASLSKEFGCATEPNLPRAPEKSRGGQAKAR